MSTAASNSIMTISRAKYGKRLTAPDYRALAGMKSIAEIAGYLKSKTRYATALTGISETAIHRANIELMLKNYNLEETYRMCHFENALGADLFRYIIDLHEVRLLMEFFVFFFAGKTGEFLARMPMSVNRYSSIDFNKLCGLKSADELSSYLLSTKYKLIAGDIKGIPQNGFTMVESKLYRMLYDSSLESIGVNYQSADTASLSKLIAMQAELYDFLLIYRAKKYYGCSAVSISSLVMNKPCIIPKKTYEQMIAAKTADEVLDLFLGTKYGKSQKQFYKNNDISRFCKLILSENIKKHIHFSNDPAVVMLSYILYSEKEVDNIINIIEGVRYGLSPQEILENTAIPDFEG